MNSRKQRVFKAKTVELKGKGKAKIEYKPPLATEDLKKLYGSQAFNMTTPTGLQNQVWFEVMTIFLSTWSREPS